MKKEELEREIKVHEYKAAQAALSIVEGEKMLEEAKQNLQRETGAYMMLKGLLANWKDETKKTDKTE